MESKVWTSDAACGVRPITVNAGSPTVVEGVDPDITRPPAGSLALSQREKRRRVAKQCSVFYLIHFLTRRGDAGAAHASDRTIDTLHAVDLAPANTS